MKPCKKVVNFVAKSTKCGGFESDGNACENVIEIGSCYCKEHEYFCEFTRDELEMLSIESSIICLDKEARYLASQNVDVENEHAMIVVIRLREIEMKINDLLNMKRNGINSGLLCVEVCKTCNLWKVVNDSEKCDRCVRSKIVGNRDKVNSNIRDKVNSNINEKINKECMEQEEKNIGDIKESNLNICETFDVKYVRCKGVIKNKFTMQI